MTKPSFFQRKDNLVAVDIDGESVMMCIDSGAYFGLNSVASILWEELSSPKKETDLCEKVMQLYTVNAETCQRDVADFLAKLESRGLIYRC